jgi:hypothetical protein
VFLTSNKKRRESLMSTINSVLVWEPSPGNTIDEEAEKAVEFFKANHYRPDKSNYIFLEFNENYIKIDKDTEPEDVIEEYRRRRS